MDKLLICGIDSLLGANFALALADRYEVVGLAASEEFELPGCRTIACDFADASGASYHAQEQSPQAIIYCGGVARSSWDASCEHDPDGELEARLVRGLSAAAERSGSHFTAITTDAIFAGPHMFHGESSPATGKSAAAEAARLVETALRDTPSLVVRSHVYGWSPAGISPGFAERAWERLSAGEAFTVDAHRYATPILASDLALLYDRALGMRLSGTYHITGAERTNQHRFAAELAVAFSFTGRQVHLTQPDARTGARPYVEETSLGSRAVRRALECPLPMLREGLQRFAEQQAGGWRDTLLGSRRSRRVGQRSAA